MPVTALTTRARRHTSRSGRVATIVRPAEEPHAAPGALTVTLNISLSGEVTPQAFRLIEAVRELVELGNGAITVTPAAVPDAPAPVLPLDPSGRPEVRLLSASRQVVVDGVLLP